MKTIIRIMTVAAMFCFISLPVHAGSFDPADYSVDTASVFVRGLMVITTGGGNSDVFVDVEGDGKGSLSIETYLDGVLLGAATVPLYENHPDFTHVRIMRIVVEAHSGGGDTGCALSSSGHSFTCDIYTGASEEDVVGTIILGFHGNTDFIEICPRTGGCHAFVEGSGFGEIAYDYIIIFNESGP